MQGTRKHVGPILSILLGLAFHTGCSSDGAPQLPPEATGTTQEAAVGGPGACINDTTLTTKWLFDQSCGCPYFGDQRDDQCSYEVGVFECLKISGFAFDCAAPPPLPVVEEVEWGKFHAYYQELNIAAFVHNDCKAAAIVQKCLQVWNTMSSPWGNPYSVLPVAAVILPHCNRALDVCGQNGNNGVHCDVWDPCTTKACAVQ